MALCCNFVKPFRKFKTKTPKSFSGVFWCTRRESNPQPSPSEGDALSSCATSAFFALLLKRKTVYILYYSSSVSLTETLTCRIRFTVALRISISRLRYSNLKPVLGISPILSISQPLKVVVSNFSSSPPSSK